MDYVQYITFKNVYLLSLIISFRSWYLSINTIEKESGVIPYSFDVILIVYFFIYLVLCIPVASGIVFYAPYDLYRTIRVSIYLRKRKLRFSSI